MRLESVPCGYECPRWGIGIKKTSQARWHRSTTSPSHFNGQVIVPCDQYEIHFGAGAFPPEMELAAFRLVSSKCTEYDVFDESAGVGKSAQIRSPTGSPSQKPRVDEIDLGGAGDLTALSAGKGQKFFDDMAFFKKLNIRGDCSYINVAN